MDEIKDRAEAAIAFLEDMDDMTGGSTDGYQEAIRLIEELIELVPKNGAEKRLRRTIPPINLP